MKFLPPIFIVVIGVALAAWALDERMQADLVRKDNQRVIEMDTQLQERLTSREKLITDLRVKISDLDKKAAQSAEVETDLKSQIKTKEQNAQELSKKLNAAKREAATAMLAA